MRWNSFVELLLLGAVEAVRHNSVHARVRSELHRLHQRTADTKTHTSESKALPHRFTNSKTTDFVVNGTAIPHTDFDIGESYAGLLPIGGDSDGELYFWFFPTPDVNASKDIIIWLNGGPGCSSLQGLLKENGPFLWPTGTYKPIKNPWSWHHLSNIVYIDQPIGTGFSQGNITAKSEKDIAEQFMGFWKNFVDTFGLHGYKVYLTGESYAGLYCPYIGSAMLDAADKKYFDMSGMILYDAVISDSTTQHIPIKNYADYWSNILAFDDKFRSLLANASKTCGFDDFVDKYLAFPPPGPQPDIKDLPGINAEGDDIRGECTLFNMVFSAAMALNPGFNVYQITQTLPIPDDVLGLPWTSFYVAEGREIYFNRTDVKRAINAPLETDWSICSKGDVFVDGYDDSDPSILRAIPHIIDETRNVQISHGSMDFILVANTSLLAIQNMTWGGKLGFQSVPQSPLVVPHHPNPNLEGSSGKGVLGTFHTERGLTWSVVNQAGHMVPAYQAAVAYRQVQLMLKKIKSLDSTQPFPQYADEPQPGPEDLGKGTVPP